MELNREPFTTVRPPGFATEQPPVPPCPSREAGQWQRPADRTSGEGAFGRLPLKRLVAGLRFAPVFKFFG